MLRLTETGTTGDMLNLVSVLAPFGFDPAVKTKLVRHQDRRWDVELLYRQGYFEIYQAHQSRPVFKDCARIVSFIGRPGTGALFVGVYEVLGVEGPARFRLPKAVPYQEMGSSWQYRYSLKRDPRFAELENRLVVDWGAGTRSWVQHLRAGGKKVFEVLPEGYVREWPGFMEVVLRHDELVKVVKNRDAHREWHRMLASVAGVYLILDTQTGNQYVGSAYGDDGLLGRWRSYAHTVHGGNKKMRALLEQRPDLAEHLQFAILQTLPVTLTAGEVIDHEIRHKTKLGSRAHGLNSN